MDVVEASTRDGYSVVHRSGFPRACAWIAAIAAAVIGQPLARAETCAPPTPACHLENGKTLLTSDPRRAAEELLASFRLDERTDTLELYATALQLGRRYALALETWKRVIVFRDSEVETAREVARTATGRKLADARKTIARAQKQSEEAAAAIIKLWPEVGRVRIRFAPGQQFTVFHDGVEVDATRDVLINARRDELVFTRKDGSVERVTVEVAAGAIAKIDAPAASPKPEVASKPQAPEPEVAPKPEPPRPELLPKRAEAAEPDEPEQREETELPVERFVLEPRSRTMSRVGLGLTAGALVAGGVAGSFGYLASRDHDRSRELGCNTDDQCPFGPAADLAQRGNDRARVARITAIAGGALLATGVTLWIVGRSKVSRPAPDVALHLGPSSTSIAWRF
jgi:hypothetical protein